MASVQRSKNALDVVGAETVTDGLQGGRILAGGEPVGQSLKPIPSRPAWRLAHSCPLSQTLAG